MDRENQPSAAEPLNAYNLEDTGERFLPGVEGKAEISYDHIARYRFAERFVAGKNLVDLGSGAGYGSYALSRVAKRVTGIDLSEEAVSHAATVYARPNLSYEVGDVTRVPYETGTFEAAVSFEVIEHLEDPEELVVEAKRLVREDGVFVVSTPDKQTYSNDRNSVNLYHLSEMYAPEFRELLERHFANVRIYRQGAISGSLITRHADELAPGGDVEVESARFATEDPSYGSEVPTTLYMIAVCSDAEMAELAPRPYLLLDRDRQIYEEYEDLYVRLKQMLAAARYHREKAGELRDNAGSTPQVRRLEQRLRNTERRLKQSERQLRNLRNSRSWKAFQKLNGARARAFRLLGAARSRTNRLLKRG